VKIRGKMFEWKVKGYFGILDNLSLGKKLSSGLAKDMNLNFVRSLAPHFVLSHEQFYNQPVQLKL